MTGHRSREAEVERSSASGHRGREAEVESSAYKTCSCVELKLVAWSGLGSGFFIQASPGSSLSLKCY